MIRQICVYIEDRQFEKLQKEANKSEVARKGLELYFQYKKEKEMTKGVDKMKIKEVKLNKNGVEVGEEENPLAMRYFSDNGNLPSGDFDVDDIKGTWVHIEGEHTNFAKYAYRSIDNSTLIPENIFRKKLINEMDGERVLLDEEWLEEHDPETLGWITSSEYWGRGYDRKPDRSQVVVELQFDKSGVKYYADLEGSKDRWPSQNQPEWGDGNWEDWAVEEIEKYYKLLK